MVAKGQSTPPPFSHVSKSQILVGLGAALLSDEKHAHVRTGGHRPLDIKVIMATLVVQRALKRNMSKNRQAISFVDVVRAAGEKACLGSGNRRRSSAIDTALGFRGSGTLAHTRRLSSTGRLSDTGQDVLAGHHQQQLQQHAVARSRAGSIVLPPDADESKWLMRRFLVDLQRSNERNEEEPVLPKNQSGFVSMDDGDGGGGGDDDDDAASRHSIGGANMLQLQNSSVSSGGGSKARTEIGSPVPGEPPARFSNNPDDGDFVEEGKYVEERVGSEEEKLEETPVTSLAMWLRGHFQP